MPYKTKSGSHYHLTYGCCGATISCSESGLVPCAICCQSEGRGGGGQPAAPSPMGAGASPASPSATDGQGQSVHRGRNHKSVPNDAGCVYVGYFIEPEQMASMLSELERQGVTDGGLAKAIACPHVTLGYMPEDAHEGQFGETVTLRVVGYGNDGQNEGVKVELLDASNEALAHLGESVACPHVTLSVANGARPVNTRYLDFSPVPEPFSLQGTFGGYTKWHKVVTSPPQPRVPTPGPVGYVSGQEAGMADGDIDPFEPMDNPAIPRTGLVSDIPALADRVRSSNGMIAVMRGSAGCGKSTLLAACGDDATVVCPDDIRMRLFGLERDENGKLGISQRDGGRVWGIARQEARQACQANGGTVVIDAMHARPRDIRQWQQLADATGRTLVVVDLTDVPREESRRRNAGRQEWKQVPDFVIDRFYDAAEGNTLAIRRQFPCVDRRGFKELIDSL